MLRCREVYSNNTDVNPDLEGYMDLDNRRYLKTTDGVELWKQRWDNHCEFTKSISVNLKFYILIGHRRD